MGFVDLMYFSLSAKFQGYNTSYGTKTNTPS